MPVPQENRLIGRTDAGGRFLLPDLAPYSPNRLATDTSELPLDAHVRTASIDVVPQQLAGLVARFEVERYVAARAPEGACEVKFDGDPAPGAAPARIGPLTCAPLGGP